MSHASTGLVSIEEAAEANKLPGTAPTDKRYPMTNQIKTCYMCAAAATLARRRPRWNTCGDSPMRAGGRGADRVGAGE